MAQPLIRVFLLTYRRPVLLRRALASLLAQTCRDWVCELHNDAPEDDSPGKILEELAPGDPRFSYHHHAENWGPLKSFNQVFAGGPEPYVALLEDDNWWEPRLLSTLLEVLQADPGASMAWANMRLWQEHPGNRWEDLGRTIWSAPGPERVRAFAWPHVLQMADALHSNGAMLCRTGGQLLPLGTPLAHIEIFRERCLPGRLLLVTEPLANFSLTLATSRSRDLSLWVQAQLLVTASFLHAVPLSPAAWDQLWRECRAARPSNTSLLLLVALAGVRRREIFSRASLADWVRFAASFLRRLPTNLRGLRFRRERAELWNWLRAQTEARVADARARGFSVLEAGSLNLKAGGS